MPESLVPVFVFPNCLKFNLSNQTTHKQVLTLYNPYDFPVKFQGPGMSLVVLRVPETKKEPKPDSYLHQGKLSAKNLKIQSTKFILTSPYQLRTLFSLAVLCSAKDRHKYTVVDPEGKIQTHCCVDIVIRHNAVTSQNIGQVDKFRIQMYQFATNKLIGKKDVTAELLEEEPERQTPERESFQQIPVTNAGQSPAQYSLPKRPVRPGPPSGFFITVAMICIATLLLPTAGEVSGLIPEYLKPSVHLKMVVSYVLGLVTMVLLKPT